MKRDKIINEGGINGIGNSKIDTNSREFILLRQKIIEANSKYDKIHFIENKIFSIKLMMIFYLNKDSLVNIIPAGDFLKMLINELNIKNKNFADYIGYKPSNLSALISGNRKISIDLACKLSHIFNIHPNIWLNIQTKNELATLEKNKYHKYKLSDLLETEA